MQKIEKEMPLQALHLFKSRTEAIPHIPQMYIYVIVEKEIEHKDKHW